MQIYPVHKRKAGLGKTFIKEEIRGVFRQSVKITKSFSWIIVHILHCQWMYFRTEGHAEAVHPNAHSEETETEFAFYYELSKMLVLSDLQNTKVYHIWTSIYTKMSYVGKWLGDF